MIRTPACTLHRAALACIALLLGGCATTGEHPPSDPFEPFNRDVYAFNHGLDKAVLRPTARGYVKVTPRWFRTIVGNFFTNLSYPGTILNQVLQGKLVAAGQDTLRFALNTTLGLAGFLDPATDANLPIHDEDLGQTLGRWGVPPGPYVMLPLLGPASMRDLPSRVADRFLEPFYWYNYGNERWFSLALSLVDTRARLLPLDGTLERAFDPYAFIRDAYLQRRLYQVYDGDVPEQMRAEPLEDPEATDDTATQPSEPGSAPPGGSR